MLKDWCKIQFQYGDPGFCRLHYALRIFLASLVSFVISMLFFKANLVWIVLATFLTLMAQADIGYVAQLKKLFITGLACVASVFIGALAGSPAWLLALSTFLYAFCIYQTIMRNNMVFLMLLTPFFSFIVSSAHPCHFDAALSRTAYTSLGVGIAWIGGVALFPYNPKKVIISIEKAIAFYLKDYINFVFLSYLTGNFRLRSVHSSYENVLTTLKQLNSNLLYLNDPRYETLGKHYFNLLAQTFFIFRMLHGAEHPDEWLHQRTSLEAIRQKCQQLFNAWQQNNKSALASYCKEMQTLVAAAHIQNDAFQITLSNIANTIQALV